MTTVAGRRTTGDGPDLVTEDISRRPGAESALMPAGSVGIVGHRPVAVNEGGILVFGVLGRPCVLAAVVAAGQEATRTDAVSGRTVATEPNVDDLLR